MSLEWLFQRMADYGERPAMLLEDERTTYRDLLAECAEWARRIAQHRIRPGEVVALEGDYSPATCSAMLALFHHGNIVLPLASSIRREELLDIAQAERSVRFQEGGWEIRQREPGEQSELLRRLASAGKAGLILLTSGTTGAPKAILHDFEKFAARYRTPRETLRTLTFLLFDHIGGLNTLLHTLANGGTLFVPPDRRPDTICRLIERHRIELLPTSPSFLNLLLLSRAHESYDLSSLRIITYGTEVMPDATLHRLHELLPHVDLRQTYGLSELGIMRVKSKASGSPWMKIGGEGVETRVVDGVLHIRSAGAMLGYLNAPDPFDSEGWFNTDDEVIEEDGYWRIRGRLSEVINVGGRKVYPAEVEDALLRMPIVSDAVVRGEANALLGQIVVAVVNVNAAISEAELKQAVRAHCQDRLEPYQIPVKVYVEEKRLHTDRFKKSRKAGRGETDENQPVHDRFST